MQKHEFPSPIEGFEHINRFWDKRSDAIMAKILPGEYYVTRHNELIATVLGSCVSACVRDVNSGIGAMNHFMLPVNRGSVDNILSDATRYGSYAMEHMLNDLFKQGARRRNLEFKLFGGGKVLQQNLMDVGQKNIDFILHYMDDEGYTITSMDLGDIYPRKIIYNPKTGKVRMKKLRTTHNDTIARRERGYMDQLKVEPVAGEIELF